MNRAPDILSRAPALIDAATADLKRDNDAADATHAARCARNHTKYSSYPVDVVLNVGGCETELRADVVFEFTPEEPQTWNYPGCPASAEVLHVRIGVLDILPLMSAEARKELSESLT